MFAKDEIAETLKIFTERRVKHAESVERCSRPMHGRSRNKHDGSCSCQ